MAERMSTATRMDRARANGKVIRMENGHRKRKARLNRDKRFVELAAKASFPFTPAILSWASAKLGTPSTQLTEAMVKAIVPGKP